MTTATHIEPIRLRISDAGRQVLVEPEDSDKFVLYVEEAIHACRIMKEYEELFHKQLQYLKNYLGKWACEHKDKVNKTFLTLHGGRMLFLVVTKNSTFDPELEDSLTDLDLNVARDPECSQINLDIQAVPQCQEEGYVSFCNPEWLLEFSMPDA